MNRFSEWLKATNMTDVATLITQGLWIWGSIRFTGVAADLMLSESTHAESHHAIGYNLAIALLAAWTGKSSLGALSHWGNRKTSREYMDKQKDIEEAKSRRPPPVVESQGGDVNVNSERPAPTSERPAPVPAPPPGDVTNRPANEPDVWRDDERGEPDPNLPMHLVGLGEPHNYNRIREPRVGVMLHYDGSTSDRGAVNWLLHDPRCHVSYNWLVLDHGALVPIAPSGSRAWHAGVCKPSLGLVYKDANSAFYGLSLAATVGETATEDAKATIAKHCLTLFRHHGWEPATDGWRIVSHASEAWPRGRKIDPVGPDQLHPVLSVEEIRDRVQKLAGQPV
jgi:hypothetical protein